MSKVVGYLVTNGERPELLNYEDARRILAQQKAAMFVVTEFGSIQDAISCFNPDCCGCLIQDISKNNEIRCNECGKTYFLKSK
jgi:DNA-directed RNA polymerase subunit RPC12/RpoP